MALVRQRQPVKLAGLDTKSDDNQAPVGSFKKADNAIYNKLGKLEKRTGYTTLTNSLTTKFAMPSNSLGYKYTNYTDNLIVEKLIKHKEQRLMLNNSNGHKKDISNKLGYVDNADVLGVDFDVKTVFSQSANNQQFQTADTLKIKDGSVAGGEQIVEAYTNVNSDNSYNIQIHMNNTVTYNRRITALQLTGSANFINISAPKIKIFEYSGGGAAYKVVLLFSVLNQVSGLYYIYAHSISIGIVLFGVNGDNFLSLGSCGSDANRRFFDMEKANEDSFVLLRNWTDFSGNVNLSLEHYLINSSSAVITTKIAGMSGNVLAPNVFKSGNCVSLVKAPWFAFDIGTSSTYNYFLVVFNEMSTTEATKTISQKIWYGIKSILVNNTSTTSLNFRACVPYDISTNCSRIVNIGCGEYDQPDAANKITTFTKSIPIYLTLETNSNVEVSQTFGGNFLNNKIIKLTYDTTLSTLQEIIAFYHQTLVSKPISLNFNDYLMSTNLNIYSSALFLNCVDKRDGIKNMKPIAKLFAENTSYFKPYPDPLGSYEYSENIDFMINYGWLSNIGVLNQEGDPRVNAISKQTFNGLNDSIKIMGLFPYRDTFENKNDIITKTREAPLLNYNQFDYNDLDFYTETKSSRCVTFELNSKKRFSSVELNDSTYFAGGLLNYYDGSKLVGSGFHVNPTIFHSEFSVGHGIYQAVANEFNTATLNFKITGNIFKAGQKVRFKSNGPFELTGISLDTAYSLQVDPTGTIKVSTEYLVFAAGVTTFQVSNLDGSQVSFSHVPSGTVYLSLLSIYKTPYGVLPYSLNPSVQVFATYEYSDINGKVCRSAPSRPIYVKNLNPFYDKMDVLVSNYLFNDKITNETINPVKICLWRNVTDGPGVYFKCGEKQCDLTSSIMKIPMNVVDDDLSSQAQLYTGGGILENTSSLACSALTTKDNRVYIVNSEDKREIRYSKKIIQNEILEFSDFQNVRIDNTDDPIINLIAMDEKIVVFKQSEIYVFAGDGVNELGQNPSFTQVERISADIGLDSNNPQALCSTQMGIMFKSNKGLYLLARGGGLEYIGAFIDDYLNLDGFAKTMVAPYTPLIAKNIYINNISNDYKINSVNVCTEVGVFTYNIEQKLWTRSIYMADYSWDSNNISSNPIFIFSDRTDDVILSSLLNLTNTTSSYTILANTIQEKLSLAANSFVDKITLSNSNSPTVTYPGLMKSVPIRVNFETNFISMAGIEHFGRLWRIYFLGERNYFSVGTKKYRVKLKFDYEENSPAIETHEYVEIFSGINPNTGSVLQFNSHIDNQKAQSFKIIFEEMGIDQISGVDLNAISSLSISNIDIEFGVKRKTPLGRNKSAPNI